MAPETAETLSLDSLSHRPVVLIDGTAYELFTHTIMSPLDAHDFQVLVTRMAELIDKPTLTPDERTELASIPGRQCALVLDAPAEVLQKLSKRQRQAVLDCFFAELPATDRSGQKTFKRSLSTGASGSPASAGSTAAAP